MPITYTPNGRLSIIISPTTLIHKLRIPTNISLPLTSPANLVIRNPPASVVLASVAAQSVWSQLRAIYNIATPAASYLLEQNFSGIFVPVETGALTGVGTNAGANNPAFLAILSFKDVLGHRLRIYVPESAAGTLFHQSRSQMGAALGGFADNVLAAVAASDIGNWGVSRGNSIIKTFSFVTSSANKRFRRKLNLT